MYWKSGEGLRVVSRNRRDTGELIMDSIIVNFAPTGMVPTKKDTPYVPISAKEIIEDVKKAFQIGITSVHLHAR
ncbi:MAG: 3-keto-5-aminohexanoate cleavage protein, partial [Selenomonadaceae bacterium]|nr:3-keto-5-aminohexanoate cleavage protein [Selenomonadaceae bacterium]